MGEMGDRRWERAPGVFARALDYMGMEPGVPLRDKPVQVLFVGSCTNARLSDLESAARVLAGRKVAPGVRMLVVPGSQQIKLEAESRGLAQVFIDAVRELAADAGVDLEVGA